MAKDKNRSVDPLEAAGVPATPVTASSNDDFESVPPVGETTPATLPEEKPAEPTLPAPGAVPPGKKAPNYTVARAVTISWGPNMLKLVPGDVISEDSYGDGAVLRMARAGVAFEEPLPEEPKADESKKA